MRILAGLILGALGGAVLVGCSSGHSSPYDVSFNAIRGNLTPELQAMTDRPVDEQRNMAVANNQNKRMFFDDLGRALVENAEMGFPMCALLDILPVSDTRIYQKLAELIEAGIVRPEA